MKFVNIIIAPLLLILDILSCLAKKLRICKTPKQFTPECIMMSSFLKSSWLLLAFTLITATPFITSKFGNFMAA